MAIKLIPKGYNGIGGRIVGAGEEPGFSFLGMNSSLILIICSIMLILSFLAAGGLWMYESNLMKKESLISNQARDLQSARDVELEEALIELDLGIRKLDEVLKKRIYPINIFKILEDLVLPEVVFSNFSANMQKAEVRIKVESTAYNKLAEQMVIFKEDFRVKGINFSGISLGESGVSSDFQITLDPIVLGGSDL